MARLFELITPLGKDVLLFRAMHAREELARLSEFDLSALSTLGDISPGDLLAKSVTVKQELRNGGHRYFNGLVTRFAQGSMVGRYYQYRMTVCPWLWFLTRTADCRIFQDKSVPEIINEVFADHPVAAFEDGLTGAYARREYCVQYRETDFEFVSRIMEEEGIYYYFEHTDGRHVLKLVDSYAGYKALEPTASIAYYAPGTQVRVDQEFIHAWTFAQSIQPGVVALDDYDFTKPKVDLAVKARLLQAHHGADYEWFDSPGEYRDTGNGENYVRARVDELHSEFERAQAEGNVREIAVGRLFTLINAPRHDQEREYLIVSATYDLRDNAYETSAEEAASYHCAFTVLQSRQQFRPARITPRAFMRGPQTAMVVGPPTEEIWTDQYGRVKVQFHWDRYGKNDQNASCWIRVSHPWAGKGWGAVAIPRIGQEVVVDFLEGNPDQPLITGRVYNADSMPPYPLPAGAVVSGMKSYSTKGGGGYNEISADDTKGKEGVTIHAQYDMSTTVLHDKTSEIKHNRTGHVVVNDTLNVDADRMMHIKGKLTETVDTGHKLTVTSGYSETISGGATRTITGDHTEDVTGKRTMTVTGPIDQSATATIDIHATGAGTYTSEASLKFAVQESVIEITPGGITISIGPSTVKIDPSGVSVSGPKISLNG